MPVKGGWEACGQRDRSPRNLATGFASMSSSEKFEARKDLERQLMVGVEERKASVTSCE